MINTTHDLKRSHVPESSQNAAIDEKVMEKMFGNNIIS